MDFDAIVEKSKAFSSKPPPEVYLEFYGLYKQVNSGDVNIEKPADAEGAAKYEAWLSRKGLSVDAAKAAYIALYEKYAPIYT
ncbi:acyl-CoA-binding protein [Drosophila sulfurigaster albostrigata]|uniref:Acyl-CoA-binding protein n=1 Tax=Drosophila albomicans TaxID=7291 RepID=A0A6P8XGN2_DROAB|nr:acyl-CoA-binding protein [Drosophila albomicans]XP_060660748.1 acyl-CoA-binding protein [Drosophila nasuta]XP_062136995.1 acyl-CoA-binding protein [Drosophila sulfurigaster albostrigata]